MTPEDLNKLLRTESESVEWKRSLGEWKEIVVSTAAMASLHGGQICIGVDPTGRVCGVELGKGTLEDLWPRVGPRQVNEINDEGLSRGVISEFRRMFLATKSLI